MALAPLGLGFRVPPYIRQLLDFVAEGVLCQEPHSTFLTETLRSQDGGGLGLEFSEFRVRSILNRNTVFKEVVGVSRLGVQSSEHPVFYYASRPGVGFGVQV